MLFNKPNKSEFFHPTYELELYIHDTEITLQSRHVKCIENVNKTKVEKLSLRPSSTLLSNNLDRKIEKTVQTNHDSLKTDLRLFVFRIIIRQ